MKRELHSQEEIVRAKHQKDESEKKIEHLHEPPSPLANLQQQIGNRAIQRLLAQREGEGSFELDEDTANRINGERSGGQPLDSSLTADMSGRLGNDFSGVKVHTSDGANQLSRQLNAVAFTTGQDIFFKEGAYSPASSSGQELVAHELTHVVQQSTGAVPSSGGMKVNAPGDVFEQEADSVSKKVTGGKEAPALQRVEQADEEEENVNLKRDDIQRQEEEEEEGVQAKTDEIHRQEEEEEETAG